MWILPIKHPKYSAYAAACVESKEESSELLEKSILLLMWKSKPLSFKTLPRLWNRAYWLPLLFGRILKPSRQNIFTTNYTESLAAIRANPSATQANEREPMIQDTFGRIYSTLSQQQSLFGASSKTWKDTLHWDMTKFTEAFEIWVTRLRATYLQRQKLAAHTREQDFLSLPSEPQNWGTPNTMDMLPERSPEGMDKIMNGARKGRTWPSNLREQVNWNTPTSSQFKGSGTNQTMRNRLDYQVEKIYPTPYAQMVSKYGKNQHQESLEVMARAGHLAPTNTNTIGKNHGLLNPAWVAQLMGTTLEKTFFECTEMALLNKPQPSHGSHFGEKSKV